MKYLKSLYSYELIKEFENTKFNNSSNLRPTQFEEETEKILGSTRSDFKIEADNELKKYSDLGYEDSLLRKIFSEHEQKILEKFRVVNKIIHDNLKSIIINIKNNTGRYAEMTFDGSNLLPNQILPGVQYVAQTPSRRYIRIIINLAKDHVKIYDSDRDVFDGSKFVDPQNIIDDNVLHLNNLETYLRNAIKEIDEN